MTTGGPNHIDGASVEQVKSFKFLGVQLTEDLKWSEHAHTVMKKVRQSLFPLQEVENVLHRPSVLQLYRYFDWLHCCLVWE